MIFRIIIGIILFVCTIAMCGMFIFSFEDYLTNASFAYWHNITKEFFANQPPVAMLVSSIISWIISVAFVYILFSTNHFLTSIILILLIIWDIISYLRTKTINTKYEKLCKNHGDIAISHFLLGYESITLLRVIIALGVMCYAIIVM